MIGPNVRAVRAARFSQTGVLRTGARARWMRFEATQEVRPPHTEFRWDARVRIAPFLGLHVMDALVAGRGSGRVELFGIKVADDSGKPELDSGALHRYLAEAVWYPTALMPSAHLQWSVLGGDAALAALSCGGTTVSLEFRFAPSGEVAGIFTPARWGLFQGRYRQAAWEGRFSAYREVQGMRVPGEGVVGWYEEGAWQPVWKGRVVDAAYEFAP